MLAMLPGCAALMPRQIGIDQRLAALPRQGLALQAPVTIRWNDHLVPWIEAASDADLAFALGLVHGHLRGAQVALLRLVSRGRLAEIAGPLATDIDHALRILDFGRAAPAIEAAWPAETRDFVGRFVAGLNHAVLHGPRPREFGLLGLRPEPFTTADILAIGRLAGSDINWLAYFSLLAERGTPGFARRWQRMLEAGAGSAAPANPGQAALGAIFAGLSRAGSNAVAIAPSRSASGAAMLASDPHLGLSLPNLWMLVGMRSPSFHLVGMMVPGLPIIGLGRNPDVAWGGTNLRAASSDLFDVSRLPPEAFAESEVTIRQRLWFSAKRRVRMTPQGPVVTDAAVVPGRPGEPVALRWAGHEATDEITALLRAARARSGAAFRDSFAGFAVSPQNMLYADAGRPHRPGDGGGAAFPRRLPCRRPGAGRRRPGGDGALAAAVGCARPAGAGGPGATACWPRPTRTRRSGHGTCRRSAISSRMATGWRGCGRWRWPSRSSRRPTWRRCRQIPWRPRRRRWRRGCWRGWTRCPAARRTLPCWPRCAAGMATMPPTAAPPWSSSCCWRRWSPPCSRRPAGAGRRPAGIS